MAIVGVKAFFSCSWPSSRYRSRAWAVGLPVAGALVLVGCISGTTPICSGDAGCGAGVDAGAVPEAASPDGVSAGDGGTSRDASADGTPGADAPVHG